MFSHSQSGRSALCLKAGSLLALTLAIGACNTDFGDWLEGHGSGHGGGAGSTSPPSGQGGAGGGGTTSPCAAILCPAGTRCEVQEVQCVRAPCPPIAVCVKEPTNPPPTDPCASMTCQAGTHCEVTPVECVAAPCPPVGSCVPDAAPVRCGGFAGIACPGMGKCVDDPADSCDPAKGGADCGGICSCVETVLCVKGSVFDGSPKVCSCVPVSTPPVTCGPVCEIYCEYGNVLDAAGCPTCRCNPAPAPATACPVEKCPTPGPKSVNYLCPDGKTVAGPACLSTPKGTCGWTIVSCPAK